MGPSYHSVCGERSTTLSPSSAEIGMYASFALPPSFAAKPANSTTSSSKRACEHSTRSILLTATTRCGIPSSALMNAWRLDCSSTPLRASSRITARSAVEAPVTMLRVYCWWPGQSAMMNRRLAVAK